MQVTVVYSHCDNLYSLGRGLYTFTAVLRSTQPYTLHATV